MGEGSRSGQAGLIAGEPGAARPQTALIVGLVLLLLLNYAWTAWDLARGLLIQERLVLGLVILAGALYLVWDRRRQIARSAGVSSRWGLLILALSVALLFVGTKARFVFSAGMSSVFLRGLAMVLCLWGLIVLLLGWRVMRHLWLPLVLLLFVYPESYLTTSWIPLRLQTLAAVASEKILHLTRTAVVRRGHVLETAQFSANVEEACSGIRSLMAVVPTALFLGALGLRKLASKVALVILSVPLAVGANTFRVVTTVLLGAHVGRRAAEGFFHYFASTGVFILSLVGLLVLMQLLRAIEAGAGGVAEAPRSAPADDPPPSAAGASPGALAVCLILLAAGAAFQGRTALAFLSAARAYPDSPLQYVPYRIQQWEGKDLEADEAMIRARHPSDWLLREYRRPGRPGVMILVFCWGPGGGTFADRRVHVPEICYPHQGMSELSSRRDTVPLRSGPREAVSMRTSVFSTPEAPLAVTSCHVAGGGRLTIPYDMPEGYLRGLLWGLRKLLEPTPYGAEAAFQFISPLTGPQESIVEEHRRLAAWFIPRAVEACCRTP